MGLPAGEIIYKAFVPTLKMALCILAGFVMTKANMLPRESNKGISLITMNLSLPCLIFASMVSAFTPTNVTAFGPLVLCAVMYQAIGGILAWIVQEVCYVPQDFRWGILVMGIISNWGNLPTAVVQTMAKEAPFNPATDVDLGVAYIAIFIFVMNTTFFALGVHKICGWDFIEEHMLGPKLPFKRRWARRWQRVHKLFRRARPTSERDSEATHVEAQDLPPVEEKAAPQRPKKPRQSSISAMMDSHQRILPTAPLEAPEEPDDQREPPFRSASRTSRTSRRKVDPVPEDPEETMELEDVNDSPPPPAKPILSRILLILAHTPPATYSIVFGLIFSLVQPLKSLLTPTDGWTETRMPDAPDGNPPLAWILDTSKFIGAMTVPMALILLGSSFARLRVHNWKEVPVAAIVAMTAMKMVIIPVFAVFVVQELRDHTGMFPPSQKIRTFVTILLSGTPAAANQLVVTQLYNPAGTANTLASFLLLQYILMFVLSTGLAAIALYIVE